MSIWQIIKLPSPTKAVLEIAPATHKGSSILFGAGPDMFGGIYN